MQSVTNNETNILRKCQEKIISFYKSSHKICQWWKKSEKDGTGGVGKVMLKWPSLSGRIFRGYGALHNRALTALDKSVKPMLLAMRW